MKQLTDAEKASFGWLEKLCEAHMYADRLGPICDYLKSTLDTAQPEPVVRYQFICSNGCGECGVKIFEFEYSRTESLSGELIEGKTYPQIVSTCCNSEVDIWDTMQDDVTGYTVSSKQPERAPLSADAYEALVDDLGEWSRHVVEDTAHITLDTHIRRTLAVHGIKQGGQHD